MALYDSQSCDNNCKNWCLVTYPRAVVCFRLQLCDLSDLLEEVRLLHPWLGATPLELCPRVHQYHLEVHGETCRGEKGVEECEQKEKEEVRGG